MTTDWPTVREGWAASVVQHMFPGMRQKHPKQFASDVQFLYDWESSVKGGTRLDPLNLRKGDYKTPMASRDAAIHYLHGQSQSAILTAMQIGDYAAAKHALDVHHVAIGNKGKMPSKIDTKTGNYAGAPMPSTLDQIGGTITDLPGAFGKDISGIGGALSNHVVLIIVAVLAVVLLAKK